eukprot:6630348-Pyramimonas_sp.AAC.1
MFGGASLSHHSPASAAVSVRPSSDPTTTLTASAQGPELFATVLQKPEGEEEHDASPSLHPH